MTDSATILLKGDKRPLDASLQQSERNFRAFGSRVTAIVAGLGIGTALRKAFSIGQHLFKEAGESERRLKAFENTVRQTGEAAGITTEEMTKLATEIQNTSRFADDAAIDGGKMLLAFKNIKGDVFKDAIRSAKDLAAFNEGPLEASIQSIGRALADPEQASMRLRREGVFLTAEQEKMIRGFTRLGREADAQRVILDALGERFGGSAQADVESFSGKWAQLTNKWGDAGERLTASLIPAFEALIPFFDSIIQKVDDNAAAFGEWTKWFVEIGTVGVGYVIEGFNMMQRAVVWAMTSAQTMIENWRDVFDLAITVVQLKIHQFVEDVKHLFTEVIPAYLNWFADNWKNILTDIYNANQAFATNVFKNMKSLFDGIMGLFRGEGFEFTWTPLLDGFKRTTEELPKIAARAGTAVERELGLRIHGLARELGEKFNENLETNMRVAFPEDEKRRVEQDIKDVAKGIDDASKAAALAAADDDKKRVKKKAEDKAEEAKTGGGAQFEALLSLSRRIQQSAASDPADKAAKASKEAGEIVKGAVLKGTQEQINALNKLPKEPARALVLGPATFG